MHTTEKVFVHPGNPFDLTMKVIPIPPQEENMTAEPQVRHIRKAAAVRQTTPNPLTHFNRADQLEQELVAARAERDEARKALEDFKIRTGIIARRYAVANDWCGEAERAVREIGAVWPEEARRFRARVRAEWFVVATVSSDETDVDTEFFANSIKSADVITGHNFEMDEDWQVNLTETDSIGFSVMSIEEVHDD
jgi:hypothetical protein